MCDTTWTRFNTFTSADVDKDVDLMIRKYFRADAVLPAPFSVYPYMTNVRINAYLEGLDLKQSENEFHKNWKDYQLTYNYFRGVDSSGYYGTFGSGNPNMQFLGFEQYPPSLAERNHVDIFFFHPIDPGPDRYPVQLTVSPVNEDGDLTTCLDEDERNTVRVSPGFDTVRDPENLFNTLVTPDSTWFVAGKHPNVRINHETQHLIYASRPPKPSIGFPNETFSMAAEYLSGAGLRDAHRPLTNSVYDQSLIGGSIGLSYSHWYLWSVYLLQQFAGDTTRVEDDLYYKWVRATDGSGSENNYMLGLARALDASEYSYLGGSGARPGDARLRNVFHNYAVAKWLDNASGSFYGGKYGLGRGITPSAQPGFFDNSFNPCDRRSVTEVPPKFAVGQARVTADTTLSVKRCVTDAGIGDGCAGSLETCDSIFVNPYGTDYIQLEASPYLESNGKSNTLRFRMTWDPSEVPGTYPAGNDLRVSAIVYAAKSDSLYLRGDQAFRVIDGCVDLAAGEARVGIPNFGGEAKSAVIVIDLADVRPESTEVNSNWVNYRRLFYSYSFGVDTMSVSGNVEGLVAFRPSGASADSVTWTEFPQNRGMGGYYLLRSDSIGGTPSVVDSVDCHCIREFTTPPWGNSIKFYRVQSRAYPLTSTNFATIGGTVDNTQTLAGSVYVAGDINVSPTDTLNVQAGSTIRFRPNYDSQFTGSDAARSEFTVWGALRSMGSATDSVLWESAKSPPSPGDWKGLRLEGAAGNASSRLEYTVVRHGYHGIYTNGMSPTIRNSRIQHSQFYGILVQNAGPLIEYSVLEQNHGAELASMLGGAPKLRHCYLRYDPSLGAGLIDDGAVFSTGGKGTFQYNTITGVGMGVYCQGVGSSPSFVGEISAIDSLNYGRNNILDFLNYGIRTWDDALPDFGTPNSSTNFKAGRNNIYTTVAPSALYVSHSSATTLNAKHNYWGSDPPDLNKFVGIINGPQIPSRYLIAFETPSGAGFNPAPALAPTEALYLSALEKESSSDLAGAVTTYRELIAQYPDDPEAERALGRFYGLQWTLGTAKSELAFVDQVAANTAAPRLSRLARRIRAPLLALSGKAPDAEAAYADLLGSEAFNSSALLVEMALIRGAILGDVVGARKAVAELRRTCTDPTVLKHARALSEMIVGEESWKDGRDARALAPSVGVRELALDQNYPNPLNPTTKFAFTLPTASRVDLRIYDVRGRLVRAVTGDYFPTGRHVLEWDGKDAHGSRVASGLYIYQLETLGRKLAHKLVVLK
ncbi:MAG: FlgD immunoglobulin-like domain containing protein [Candidatus Eisenbacteria bacterium]